MSVKQVFDATQSRLILLYLVNRMTYGAAHEEIVGLNMDNEWMLYFDLEQQLLDLCDIGLLKVMRHDAERYYYITAEGMEIIELYRRRIPLSVRTRIDSFVQTSQQHSPQKTEVSARYTQNSEVDYTVKLKILDHFQPLMELTISAPSEHDAQNLCKRFERFGPSIYAKALDLLSEEEEK